MAAVGKSSLAEAIASKYNLRSYSAGALLRKIAQKNGFQSTENFWDTEEGFRLCEKRKTDTRFDKQLDQVTTKYLDKGDVVVTAWAMPWIYQNKSCLKIWLKASLETRALRMSSRDKIPFNQALKRTKQRDGSDKLLLFRLYRIRLERDLTPFDLVLNTERLTRKRALSVVLSFVNNCAPYLGTE